MPERRNTVKSNQRTANRGRMMLLAGGTLGLMAGCAAPRSAMVVPEPLKPATGQVLSLSAHGIGVQIYECRGSGDDPTTFAWALKGPEAQLHYEAGKALGKHYAGPTWEANDGSTVVGEVTARDPGPDPTAIPWLLLRAKQTSGNGVFGAVNYIQRLHTAGGKEPSTGCSPPYAGTEVRVAYSADYYFYTAAP